MNYTKHIILALFLLFGVSIDSQINSFVTAGVAPKKFTSPDDIFGCRAFIENRGQYADIEGKKVLYAMDNDFEKIYFTRSGLIYELKEFNPPLTERENERIEHGKIPPPPKVYYVSMNWEGSNSDIALEPGEQQAYYMTYGSKDLNSHVYKKITYFNVYKNIDIEYIIPKDKKSGVKYSLIIHPGGKIEDVKIAYTGDVSKIKNTKENGVQISTPLEDIIEHAPRSYYETGETIASTFVLNDNVITYSLAASSVSDRKIIVDPWVSSTNSLTSNSLAYDVDFDFFGKTFVYGGSSVFKVACYNNTGVLQWVFMGLVSSISWNSNSLNYASNFGVDKFKGKTYIGQGFVPSTGVRVVRLDASGNYDNYVSIPNSSYNEVWDMGFHCVSTNVFVMGGGTSSNITAATMDTITGALTLSTFHPTITLTNQDIVSHALDDQGSLFVIYAGPSAVNNKLSLVAPSFTNNIYLLPSGFSTFGEVQNKNSYVTPVSSNGFNCLAVNANFLFYYDGNNIAAYNKLTGGQVASTTAGLTQKQQGGIAVDDCNNLYLGGNGNIRCYNFNGTAFSTLTPISINSSSSPQYVYDIKLDKTTKTLYACGSNFVGVYSPVHTIACATASSICLFNQGGIYVSSNNITCASLGSATCTATGGTGPFTYTWLPSMQTTSVASNLQPGNHSIIVKDIGANNTYTAVTYITPLVPLTGSVPSPLALNCTTTNTIGINNLVGGSGNYKYLWKSASGTQTTATANNLTAGNHTITVTDSLSNCVWTQTFSAVPPPALSMTVSPTATIACANTSITVYGFVSAGSPNYTYSWTGGPQTASFVASESVGGTYVYTFTATDTKFCSLTKTIALVFTPAHTITVNSASICPGKIATLTANGASSYTWTNNNSTNNPFTDSPAVNTIYTVTGSGSLCASTATAQISILSIPSPTLTTNSPICNGLSLQLTASGGTGYAWSGPAAFSSGLAQSVITNAAPGHSGIYTATVTAANTCTASATINVTIHPTPGLTAAGGTVCITSPLNLSASSPATGVGYLWSGPNNFTSSLQNPTFPIPAVNQSGNYTVTITDNNACKNKAVVNVTVSSLPTASFTTNSPQCENANVIFNGGVSLDAISYSWTGPNNFLSVLISPTITGAQPLASGLYTLTVTRGACQSSFTSNIVVNPLPQLTVNLNPTKICETKSFSLQLSTSPGVNGYSWKGPNGFKSASKDVFRDTVTITHAGMYSVTITDNNQCSSSATQLVSILKNPLLTAPDVTVCLFSPALLQVSGASLYTWIGPSVFGSSATATVMSASNTSPVTYTVIGTDANQCLSRTTLTLTTLPLPKPYLSLTPNSTLCVNEVVTFEGFGGLKYQWRGPNSLFYEKQKVSINFNSITSGGVYTLTVADKNGCMASVDTLITVYDLPSGGLLGKTQGCTPLCLPMIFSPSSPAVKSVWKDGQIFHTGPNFTVCVNEPGIYDVTGSLADTATGCKSTISFSINAFENPRASFVYDPLEPTEYDQVYFTSNSQGEELTSFQWYIKDQVEYSKKGPSANYIFKEEGNYPVVLVVSNVWGCADTSIQTLQVYPDFHIYVPNIFTPNNDEHNEVFLPIVNGPRVYHLMVFDRWGELVFETTDHTQGWDGTFRGQKCKVDSYVWKMKVAARKGEVKELSGSVTLSR